jgi:DnaJ-domain-containing protein 1
MSLRVRRVTPEGLLEALDATLYVVVRLDPSPTAVFHRGVAEFFESAWPDLVRCATLCRADVRNPAWWDEVFRSAVGPIRGGVKDGYYLFEGGLVVGHHNGVIRHSGVHYAADPEVAAQRARVKEHAFRNRDVPEDELEPARQIAAYLDAIIARKQRPADAGHRGGYVYDDRGYRPPEPPAAPAENDPFTILGIARTATDDEVKSAYRQQMKENHPDRVAHLSKALQAFALAQTLAIQQAYEAIRSKRGL